MNSEILTRRRLIRYLTPVLASAVFYNINRFFEAEVKWIEKDCETGNITTCTYIPVAKATELRMENETYNLCVLSIRCLVLGLFPLIILGFLNTKIYKDVQERRARNVPVGSSSLQSNNRRRGVSFRGMDPLEDDQPTPSKTKFKWSSIHGRITMKTKRRKKRAEIYQQTNGVSANSTNNGLRTAIVIEELIPLR